MNPSEQYQEAGRQLSLPMTAIFTVKTTSDGAVAHALDFDLVAVALTSHEALKKLRAAVKHHIEFGFKHNLKAEDIQMRAPEEFWSKGYNGTLTLGEDIEIDHQRILTRVLINEVEPCSTVS